MPRRAGILLLAVATLAFAQGAEQRPIDLRARICFQKSYRGGWIPILLDNVRNLTNQDIDLQVVVSGDEGEPSAESFLSIPRQELGGRKRAFLYAYDPSGTHGLKLKAFRRGEGRPLFEQTLDGNYFTTTGIVVVSGGSTAEPLIRSAVSSGNGYACNEPTTMACAAEAMPDRWIGYSQADLVVLADLPWDKVDDRSWRALVEWVKSGGTVLISPKVDASWLKDPHLRDLCAVPDFHVDAARHLGRGLDTGTAMAFAAFRGGEEVLGSGCDDGAPLLLHSRAEFGHVYLLAVDIATAPFLGWRGFAPLWKNISDHMPLFNPNDLMDRGQSQSLDRGYYGRNGEADFALRRVVGQGLSKLPNLWGIVALLVSFILLAGPINYLALRRLRRPLWTAFTIPALSLLFVAVTLVMGYVTKGRTAVVQRLTFQHVLAGRHFTVESGYVCVRAATPGEYDLSSDAATAPRVLRPGEQEYTVSETEEMGIRGFALHMWEEGYYRADAVRNLEGTIEIAHPKDGGPLISNKTRRRIRGAAYVELTPFAAGVVIGMVRIVGAIGPGETRAADARLARIQVGSGKAVSDALGLTGMEASTMEQLLDTQPTTPHPEKLLYAVMDDGPAPLRCGARRLEEKRSLTVLCVHEP